MNDKQTHWVKNDDGNYVDGAVNKPKPHPTNFTPQDRSKHPDRVVDQRV